MKKIELSVSTAMSLLALSSSGSEEVEEVEEVSAIDNLSDEEFEKLSEEEFAKLESGGSVEDEDDGDAEEDHDLGDDDEEDLEEESNQEEPTEAADEEGSEEEESDGESEGDQPNTEVDDQAVEQYKAVYEQLFGRPIKASGREVRLKDATQAINLIEMGVDYNKKMQYMRPHMQVLKTFEKEGLLQDQNEINLLLEARKGNPDAIKKLIEKNNLDLVDLADRETPQEYIPENQLVSEKEVEIDNALSAIKESPAYEKTIEVMTHQFDPKSKQTILENPSYITAINHDIESGIYDRVMDMVQYQRDIKAIPDTVSDIDAYISTVQRMAAAEQQQMMEQQSASVNQTNDLQGTQQRRNKGASKRQKAAMSGTKRTRSAKQKEYDPLEIMDMSDDEFERQFGGMLR